MRSRHMLRPEPVSQIESEREGPDLVSERDGPKVGVLPLQSTAPRRSQQLLDKNIEGNRLIEDRKRKAARVPTTPEAPFGGNAHPKWNLKV